MSTKTSDPSITGHRPTVFLSYSHQDEDWKDRVVGHLKVLEADLDVWDDRRIARTIRPNGPAEWSPGLTAEGRCPG